MSQKILLLLMSLLIPLSAKSKELEWIPVESLQKNRTSLEAFDEKDYKKSLDSAVDALQVDPFRFEHHMNLALNFELLGESERALRSYQSALKYAETPEQKFMGYFNLGQIYGKAKKIPEAIDAYQSALDLVPTSLETKHNIELLTQMSGQGQQGEQKDQQQGGQGQDKKEQEKKDEGSDKKDEKDKKDSDQNYQQSPKYKPRNFEGKELSEADVKQILNELKQQEQRIRGEFNRKERKEAPRDKDW